ncbi:hypothetical protein FG386_001061 [Cryptosporidium ryanae]|uniref:uncharacterized protein n=1 Tax=Cryptosporidium ryanae TaxID=515981 RepID=UPI00351A1F31|nr:hypothetical protein FG386_001061 [Cryptosporidium ryanae]
MWILPDKLEIIEDKLKGRCIIAKEDIQQGELIFREIPYCYILFREYNRFMCDYCFVYFGEEGNYTECEKCNKVRYCSNKCLKESNKIHEIECGILHSNEINEIAVNVGVTYDRAFLLMRFLIITIIELTSGTCDKTNLNNNYLIPNFKQICVLEDNLSKFSKDTLEIYNKLSSGIINIPIINEIIKKHNLTDKLNVNLLVKVICIIDTNSFGIPTFSLLNKNEGLYDPKLNFVPNNSLELTFSLLSPNITGWGLFSYLSLLNHSCDPNCGFIGVNGSYHDNENKNNLFVDLIANKMIKKNEEINISYVETYESRRDRIKTLFQTKHFLCQCNRCSSEFNISKDKFIEGFLCSKCFNDSLCLIRGENNELNTNILVLSSESLNESYKLTNLSSIVDDNEYLIFQLTNTYECTKCKETFFGSEVAKVVNEFNNTILEAEKLNNEMYDLYSAVELLLKLVDKYLNNTDPNVSIKPHPMNHLFYKCYKLIAFWSIILRRWNDVDKYISFMIDSHIFISNNSINNINASNLYATKAVALYNSNKISESESVWSMCKSTRKICCRTNHPLYSLIPIKFSN